MYFLLAIAWHMPPTGSCYSYFCCLCYGSNQHLFFLWHAWCGFGRQRSTRRTGGAGGMVEFELHPCSFWRLDIAYLISPANA